MISSLELSETEAINEYLQASDRSFKVLHRLKDNVMSSLAIRSMDEKTVTYSKNFFIPVTRLCRDYCKYCAFRLSKNNFDEHTPPYIPAEEIKKQLEMAKKHGCSEILFTLGQSPEERYPIAQKWLDDHGYPSTIDYLYFLCEMCLNVGLLPHSNPGIMSESDFKQMKQVNASMGLMMESFNENLSVNPDGPHYHAPSKYPSQRRKMLQLAGEQHHPFTTGLLLGIGESRQDIVDALLIIKEMQQKYGHIQEIILQPFTPHPRTYWAYRQPASVDYLLETILLTYILNPTIPIQVPPNLNFAYQQCLSAGCRDFGGVSPITLDYVNPENRWPAISILQAETLSAGLIFRERLPVYPKFVRNSHENWLSPKIKETIEKHTLASLDGYKS